MNNRTQPDGDEMTKDALWEHLEKIKKAKQEWEATADSLNDLICLVDRQGKLIRANRAVETWGLAQVWNVKGRDLHGLAHPDCLSATCVLADFLCRAWGELAEGRPSLHEFEDQRLQRYLAIQVRPISAFLTNTESLSESFAVVVIHDDTERHRLERQIWETNYALENARREAEQKAREAEMANRAKSAFLAAMSHDIRIPMHGITGIFELLLDTELTSEQKEYLTVAETSAHSLMKLLSDILDFSKIEAGQLNIDQKEFDLQHAVATVATMLAPHAHKKGVEFFWEIEPGIPLQLVGDVVRLQEVLSNLLGNSIKFTETGEIVLRVVQSDTPPTPDAIELHFSVKDTGIGIAVEKQQQIFNAFTQADPSIVREFGGTGLGLAIARNLVELMRGKIWVESLLGQGSTFHFTSSFGLPSEYNAQTAQMRDDIPLNEVSALIIEDHETNRRILHKLLVSWGIHVTEAQNGYDGLRLIEVAREQKRLYDIILLDSVMPELSGLDLLNRLDRAIARERVILMISGDAEFFKERKRHQLPGVATLLHKPVNPSFLFDAIVAAVGKSAETPAETPPVMLAPLQKPPVSPLHLLVAEDHEINRMIVEKWMQKRGWRVTMVNNGYEVLQALQHHRFDGILMDIQMPRMDGLTATKLIREFEQQTKEHIPIIALTAHAMEGDRDRFLNSGMDGYVTKPLNSEQLYAAIEGCMTPERRTAAPSQHGLSLQQPMLNIDELLLTFDYDMAFIEELMTTYLRQSSPEMLTAIRQAICAKDLALLQQSSHRLKGAAGVIGAIQVYMSASLLEQMALEKRLDDAQDALQRLEEQMRALEEYIHQHLQAYLPNFAW